MDSHMFLLLLTDAVAISLYIYAWRLQTKVDHLKRELEEERWLHANWRESRPAHWPHTHGPDGTATAPYPSAHWPHVHRPQHTATASHPFPSNPYFADDWPRPDQAAVAETGIPLHNSE